MQAMIFAAGLGTRFKPWTNQHPKALAVINGKSLLQRNIEYLQQWGIRDVVVNVHHFADQIEQAVAADGGWGSNIRISDERAAVLETGGGLLFAKPLLQGNEPFATINVDILTDLDLGEMIRFHQEQDALVTLAVTDRSTSRYLLFDDKDRLYGWRNTATGAEKIPVPKSSLIQKAYSGIAVFSSRIFDLIQQEGKFSLIDVYLSLAADHKILAFDHSGGKLVDVGKPESVAVAENLFV